jgi:hypothetical protein
MKLFLGALALCTSVFAHAGTATLDARMDYVSLSANDDAKKANYQAFQVSRARLDLNGKLSELTSARARLDLLSAPTAATTRDRTSKFLDFAFITRKIGDDYTLSMGKVITGMGGIEASNNFGDLYLRSLAGDEVGLVYWPVGAIFGAKFGDHDLKLTIANNTQDTVNPGGTFGVAGLNQTRNMLGVTYTSKLMGGMIQPNVSIYQDKLAASSNSLASGYVAAGIKSDLDPVMIEFDILNNTYSRDTSATNDVQSTRSIVGLVRYQIAGVGSAHLKIEDSAQKISELTNGDYTKKRTGVTAAFEYKPIKEENWRAHFAITQNSLSTPDIGTAAGKTVSEQVVYVGMRTLMDFIK